MSYLSVDLSLPNADTIVHNSRVPFNELLARYLIFSNVHQLCQVESPGQTFRSSLDLVPSLSDGPAGT